MALQVEEFWRTQTGFDLTATQVEIIQAVLGGVASRDHAVIEGPAGTGKSTVMSALVLEAGFRDLEVAIAAPTHKAAKVLGRMLAKLESEVSGTLPEPVTIHSLLKLVPVRARPGQPEGLRQKGTPELRGLDLLIVDECSMIGKELYSYIVEAASEAGIALLFTGDSCQLQPVNEYRLSPAFNVAHRYVLTEVLRHDGAVLKLATRARKLKCPQVLAAKDGSSEVSTYSSADEMREGWLTMVKQAHLRQVPAEQAPVMLCWTNHDRRQFNKEARQHIYGVDVPDFMQGDQIVTLNAFMNGDTVLIANNVDVQVESAEFVRGYKPFNSSLYSYDAWSLQLRDSLLVYVLADHARLSYTRDLRNLGAQIKQELKEAEAEVKSLIDRKAGEQALKKARNKRDCIHYRWRAEYFPLKEAFIDVDFSYACTIHKSQGSTYQDVFIWNDYETSPERKELLYVAVTRAAKSVHHLHVGLRQPALAVSA